MRIGIVNDNKGNVLVLENTIRELTDHEIIWVAENGAQAVAKCVDNTPDLVLMDLLMPVMDGVQATREIMEHTPCAILIVTASISTNAALVFEAMGAGALDVVKTPSIGGISEKDEKYDLARKIQIVKNLVSSTPKTSDSDKNDTAHPDDHKYKNQLVVFGASTGGPGVLATILKGIPADFHVPIIIIQHVDSSFAGSFADWLNKQCILDVSIAKEGDVPQAGSVLIAGTNEHLVMTKSARLAYSAEPEDYIYKPSVNVFFNSVAKYWQGDIVASLLTGMGKDGAEGLANIHNKNGYTITQTKETCAVYGMPKAADELGCSNKSLDPDDIASMIMELTGYNHDKKMDQA